MMNPVFIALKKYYKKYEMDENVADKVFDKYFFGKYSNDILIEGLFLFNLWIYKSWKYNCAKKFKFHRFVRLLFSRGFDIESFTKLLNENGYEYECDEVWMKLKGESPLYYGDVSIFSKVMNTSVNIFFGGHKQSNSTNSITKNLVEIIEEVKLIKESDEEIVEQWEYFLERLNLNQLIYVKRHFSYINLKYPLLSALSASVDKYINMKKSP